MVLALPAQQPAHQPSPSSVTPPRGGWYWNDCRLVRAWLPLIGLEGLGLLDLYLALADHRPGSDHPGWAAITLSELAHLSGWGRARVIRLNRLLVAAGLLVIQHQPVAGRGPAVQRALYRVVRDAAPPAATTLSHLQTLATSDPSLAARLRRRATSPPADARPLVSTAPTVSAASTRPAPSDPPPAALAAGADTVPRVEATEPVPVPSGNRSIEEEKTDQTTTTSAPAREAFQRWQAANGRVASCLEQQRLTQLAASTEASARAAGADGWQWVAAAISEAVEAGSHYVAPRRVARILERWQAVGRPDQAPVQSRSARGRPPLSAGRRCERRPVQQQRLAPRCTAERTAVVASRSPARPAGPDAMPPITGAPERSGSATDQGRLRPLADAPAAPAALLQAALAVAGLTGEVYLRGAVLLGQAPAGPILVGTPVPLPAVIAARLTPRLARGLSALLGRVVGCRLVEAPAPASPPASICSASVGV